MNNPFFNALPKSRANFLSISSIEFMSINVIKYSAKRKDVFQMCFFKSKKKTNLIQSETAPIPQFIGETPYEKLSNLVIHNPSITLQKDEVCFYEGTAKSYHKKNVVTGYKGNGAGVSVRLTKGVSVHTGGSGKQAIRQDVIDTFDGQLFLTNKRVILLAEKYGFVISIPKILQVIPRSNGIVFHVDSKQHTVLTDDSKYICEIIKLMNSAYEDQENVIS